MSAKDMGDEIMINAYLTDVITLVSKTFDEWNQPIAELTEAIPARIVYKTRRIVNFNGEIVDSDKSVILHDRELNHADMLEIDGERFPMQKITKKKDFSWEYLEIFL